MNADKDIKTYNYKGEYHGYQEWYYYGKLTYRGNRNKDYTMGYTEWHVYEYANYYVK